MNRVETTALLFGMLRQQGYGLCDFMGIETIELLLFYSENTIYRINNFFVFGIIKTKQRGT